MHTGEMPRQQGTADLLAYWTQIRGKRPAPNRSDIDPSQIHHVLCDSFMVEIDPLRQYPMRLSGARLDAFGLKKLKGGGFLDLWAPQDRRSLAAALLTVVDCAIPFAGVVEAKAKDFASVEMELLLLPLRCGANSPPRILGALTPDYQPGWVGQVAAEPLELRSLRMLARDSAPIDHYRQATVTRSNAPPPRATRPTFVVHEGGRRQ